MARRADRCGFPPSCCCLFSFTSPRWLSWCTSPRSTWDPCLCAAFSTSLQLLSPSFLFPLHLNLPWHSPTIKARLCLGTLLIHPYLSHFPLHPHLISIWISFPNLHHIISLHTFTYPHTPAITIYHHSSTSLQLYNSLQSTLA